ncbi:MAG: ArnT family glycosyltransferase [Candidatus Kapaibacterium sp.]
MEYQPIKTKWKIILWAVILILFAPSLFYPYSADLAVFMEGGRAIVEGKTLYLDFVDLKPPVIYYVFAFIISIFGNNEFAPRIFDAIYQSGAIYLMIVFLRRISGRESLAYLAGIVYAFSYSKLGFSGTAQTESMISLPLAGILWVQYLRSGAASRVLLRGGLAGFIASVKFTMGIVLVAILLDDLLSGKYTFREFLRNSALTIASFIGAVLITFIPILINAGAFENYIIVMEYLATYSANPQFDMVLIRDGLKNIAGYFGDIFSLLFTTSMIAAPVLIFSRKSVIENQDKIARLIRISLIFCMLMLLSVFVEKKFHGYHYLRMLLPMSFLASVGLAIIWRRLREYFINGRLYTRGVIAMLALTAIVFSPVPRWLNIAQLPVLFITNERAFDSYYERSGSKMVLRVQQKKVADYINKNGSSSDKVLLVATGSAPIITMLPDATRGKFSQSAFVLGTYANKKWYGEFFEDVTDSDWIIVQNNDVYPHINAHIMTSWQSLEKREVIMKYLRRNFDRVYETTNYYVFRRTSAQ